MMEELYFKLENGTVVDIFFGSDNEPADENADGYISINGITSDFLEDGGELDYYGDVELKDMIPDILEEMGWSGNVEFISEDEYEIANEKMYEKFNKMRNELLNKLSK